MDYRQAAVAARKQRRRYIALAGDEKFHAIGSRIVGGELATVCGIRTSPGELSEDVVGDYRPHPFCPRCDADLNMALNIE